MDVLAGRGGGPACCYETQEDGQRNEQSERDEEEGVRKVGMEGGQSDNADLLTHRFTRAVGPPFPPPPSEQNY